VYLFIGRCAHGALRGPDAAAKRSTSFRSSTNSGDHLGCTSTSHLRNLGQIVLFTPNPRLFSPSKTIDRESVTTGWGCALHPNETWYPQSHICASDPTRPLRQGSPIPRTTGTMTSNQWTNKISHETLSSHLGRLNLSCGRLQTPGIPIPRSLCSDVKVAPVPREKSYPRVP